MSRVPTVTSYLTEVTAANLAVACTAVSILSASIVHQFISLIIKKIKSEHLFISASFPQKCSQINGATEREVKRSRKVFTYSYTM